MNRLYSVHDCLEQRHQRIAGRELEIVYLPRKIDLHSVTPRGPVRPQRLPNVSRSLTPSQRALTWHSAHSCPRISRCSSWLLLWWSSLSPPFCLRASHAPLLGC